MISSHGGENFIKFRGKTVVLSEELNRALKEMEIKKKYKELLFILDTCEGLSLWDHVEVDNIYFVSSSKKDQKASSSDYNWDYMMPLSDKFHNSFFIRMKNFYNSKNFDSDMKKLFSEMQKEKAYLTSDVSIVDKLGKETIKFSEFFGNPNIKNSRNVKLLPSQSLNVLNELILNNPEINKNLESLNKNTFDMNKNILDNYYKIEDEISNVNKYEESTFHLGTEDVYDKEKYNYINTIIDYVQSFVKINFLYKTLILFLGFSVILFIK